MQRREARGSPPEEQQSAEKRRQEALDRTRHCSRSASVLPSAKSMLVHLLALYVSIPLLLRLFPVILAKVIYLNMLRVPFFVDLKQPELLLNRTTNFYLTPEEGVTVGVWHMVPKSREEEARGQSNDWFEASLADDNPAIIYLHGNAGTRAGSHRIHLMKVLSEVGFHVFALDYRGYGDSTGDPSEDGLTTDAIHLYEWVKARKGKGPVCFWGHSLGTGVATNAGRILELKGSPVDAVILEAPFTNIREAVAQNMFVKFYRLFPGYEYFFLEIPALNNMFFANDENVKKLSSPLLILHAEDDHIVPMEMGTKLYEIAQTSRDSKDSVKLVTFPATKGYRHNEICREPELGMITREFVNAIKA